jgi:hypothetical protein
MDLGGPKWPPKIPRAAHRTSARYHPGMEAVRLLALLNVLVPLLFFMASVYLTLHMVFARVIVNPQSPVLWFFGIVTGPLTRPVRAVLPSHTPERRVRAVALCVYVLLWVMSRVALAGFVGAALS